MGDRKERGDEREEGRRIPRPGSWEPTPPARFAASLTVVCVYISPRLVERGTDFGLRQSEAARIAAQRGNSLRGSGRRD